MSKASERACQGARDEEPNQTERSLWIALFHAPFTPANLTDWNIIYGVVRELGAIAELLNLLADEITYALRDCTDGARRRSWPAPSTRGRAFLRPGSRLTGPSIRHSPFDLLRKSTEHPTSAMGVRRTW